MQLMSIGTDKYSNANCFLLLAIYNGQVQNLIERCLQLYMSQKEVVGTLLQQAKIEPGFTELGMVH